VRVLLLDCLRAKARFAGDPATLARLGEREEELRAMLRGLPGGAAVEAAAAFAIAEDARLTASQARDFQERIDDEYRITMCALVRWRWSAQQRAS
jgi:hypothetical protein